jgi:hypothetical protein
LCCCSTSFCFVFLSSLFFISKFCRIQQCILTWIDFEKENESIVSEAFNEDHFKNINVDPSTEEKVFYLLFYYFYITQVENNISLILNNKIVEHPVGFAFTTIFFVFYSIIKGICAAVNSFIINSIKELSSTFTSPEGGKVLSANSSNNTDAISLFDVKNVVDNLIAVIGL